jgi:hypothetical protein
LFVVHLDPVGVDAVFDAHALGAFPKIGHHFALERPVHMALERNLATEETHRASVVKETDHGYDGGRWNAGAPR